jgi:predicted nucleic acid-binding protein
MPIETGLVDANVLVYAMDADAPRRCNVTSQIFCEFYSVVTNAKRVSNPRSPMDALAAISQFLRFLQVLPIPPHAVELWLDLLRRHPVRGPKIFDLQIAAAMQANGVQRVYTFNTGDFAAFSELSVLTP